jgi:hypothetical protein
MRGFNCVSVGVFFVKLPVGGMEIDSVASWNEGEGFFDICFQLGMGLWGAGIMARYGNPIARGGLRGGLKSPYVVSLPAVEGNRNRGETLKG